MLAWLDKAKTSVMTFMKLGISLYYALHVAGGDKFL